MDKKTTELDTKKVIRKKAVKKSTPNTVTVDKSASDKAKIKNDTPEKTKIEANNVEKSQKSTDKGDSVTDGTKNVKIHNVPSTENKKTGIFIKKSTRNLSKKLSKDQKKINDATKVNRGKKISSGKDLSWVNAIKTSYFGFMKPRVSSSKISVIKPVTIPMQSTLHQAVLHNLKKLGKDEVKGLYSNSESKIIRPMKKSSIEMYFVWAIIICTMILAVLASV